MWSIFTPALIDVAPALLGLRVDGNTAAWMVDRAVEVGANGAGGACACTVDDDYWL
jgi:hypothetical protein